MKKQVSGVKSAVLGVPTRAEPGFLSIKMKVAKTSKKQRKY